ncbi:hypothetical protein [Catenulispora pinisilvae]|uniref:hypothetical protein n=1 Tax=Catenulispora pinisilvae TaxID=2705253 RepID=UPI001891FFA8|nr:hypothetical protein [Catenulispora pinisilvae]
MFPWCAATASCAADSRPTPPPPASDGANNQIGNIDWLAGDTDLLDALDGFTGSWANAATIMNTYSAQLSSMARSSAAQFQQTDSNLAKQTPHGRRPITY